MDSQSEINARILRVVRSHQAGILRLAYAYVRHVEDAEDIAQEVFLSFFRAALAFNDAEHEKAFLLRMTINRCKNQLKSAWNRKRGAMPELAGQAAPEDSPMLSYVLSLDEKYRMPLHLHYYEGYSIKEIAAILGEKPATIGTRLARGRELLKMEIGGIENVQ